MLEMMVPELLAIAMGRRVLGAVCDDDDGAEVVACRMVASIGGNSLNQCHSSRDVGTDPEERPGLLGAGGRSEGLQEARSEGPEVTCVSCPEACA